MEWIRAIIMVVMGLPMLLLGIGATLTGVQDSKSKAIVEGIVYLILGGILIYAGLTGTPLGSGREDIPMYKI